VPQLPPRHDERDTALALLRSACFSQRFIRQLNGVSLVAAAAVPPEQQLGYEAAGDVKAELYRALEGGDRGIFGMTSAKRSDIHGLVELLESRNPAPEPTAKLQEKVRTYCMYGLECRTMAFQLSSADLHLILVPWADPAVGKVVMALP
jgi:hypothetical protein